MAASSEQAQRPGFIERASHSLRNFFLGTLAVEGVAELLLPVVSFPARLIGGEALLALGADIVYQSEKDRHNP